MGEMAEELDAELRAAMGMSAVGQFMLEHEMLPPRTAPANDETILMLLEYQRVLGELLVRLANEVDDLKSRLDDRGAAPVPADLVGDGDGPVQP
jgi:hypothetical protein